MRKWIFLSIVMLLPFGMILKAQDVATAEKPKVEVYYFHATMRCHTCLAIEEQTRKTLDEDFADAVKSGIIQLKVLNLEDKENKSLVEKFGIGWSSLILYVPASNKIINLTDDGFSYAYSKPEEFRNILQAKIKELM
jgi:hypothetical protein